MICISILSIRARADARASQRRDRSRSIHGYHGNNRSFIFYNSVNNALTNAEECLDLIAVGAEKRVGREEEKNPRRIARGTTDAL